MKNKKGKRQRTGEVQNLKLFQIRNIRRDWSIDITAPQQPEIYTEFM